MTDIEEIAQKAAEIGYTYGSLGRDYWYVRRDVSKMVQESLGTGVDGPPGLSPDDRGGTTGVNQGTGVGTDSPEA